MHINICARFLSSEVEISSKVSTTSYRQAHNTTSKATKALHVYMSMFISRRRKGDSSCARNSGGDAKILNEAKRSTHLGNAQSRSFDALSCNTWSYESQQATGTYAIMHTVACHTALALILYVPQLKVINFAIVYWRCCCCALLGICLLFWHLLSICICNLHLLIACGGNSGGTMGPHMYVVRAARLHVRRHAARMCTRQQQ